MSDSLDRARRVLVVGGTGLVGSHALRLLLGDARFERVYSMGRRMLPPEFQHEKLAEVQVDFAQLPSDHEAFRVDCVLCALGTTIRKAGSQEAFRQVDFDACIQVAAAGQAAGARQFVLVSAMGAEVSSRFFYNRVKGETEQALRAMSFASLTIVRPSLLLGERKEWRLGEEIAKPFGWLLPERLRPVHASQVAAAMVAAAAETKSGVTILENSQLRQFPLS